MNKLRNVVQFDEGFAGTLSEIASSFLTKPKKNRSRKDLRDGIGKF